MSLSTRLISCGALALAVLGAAGFLPSAPSETPRDGGTLVYGEAGEPSDLNCVRTSESPAVQICRWVGDTLLAYDANNEVVPRLASSSEFAPDGRTVTLHLRRGVRWHDGKPFTAEDVLYTIRQIRDPKALVRGTLASLFEPLESITAPDPFTIVSRFREPYALAAQAWVKATILPAHLPFEPGAVAPTDRRPIGTGPFKFVRWDAQEKIVLEANPDYFLGRPHLDRIIVRYIPDPHTRSVAGLSGDVDVTNLSIGDVPSSDSGLPVRLMTVPLNSIDLVMWNVREPRNLFADARVRKALAIGFDRVGSSSLIWKGTARPATSTFIPESWAHDRNLTPLPYDPARARKLLGEAGWRDRDGDGILDTTSGPAAFTLDYPAGRPSMESLALLIQTSFKQLGLDVRLQPIEPQALRTRVRAHQFEAAIWLWGLEADPDPSDFFATSRFAVGQNFGGYSSAEMDRLMEKGRGTKDRAEREKIYHRIEALLQDEQPYMFVAHESGVVALNRRLKGIELGSAGFLAYPAPVSWWLEPPATAAK